MSKKKRLQMQKRNIATQNGIKIEVDGDLPESVIREAVSYFDNLAGPLEFITDDLVNELVAKGMEKKRIEEARRMGMKYSRKRNSFWVVENED